MLILPYSVGMATPTPDYVPTFQELRENCLQSIHEAQIALQTSQRGKSVTRQKLKDLQDHLRWLDSEIAKDNSSQSIIRTRHSRS